MGSSVQLNKNTKHLFFLLLYLLAALITFSQLPTKTGISGRPACLGIVGDTADIKTQPKPGLLLAGGGGDVDAAMKWLLERSGGGDIVIIRASGGTGYNDYLFNMGGVNSVETLLIDSRELAENDTVVQIIRHAEGLFIAGGDQWNYTRFWMGTKLNHAINDLINKKKVPVGGTSAGLAILGQYFFDAKNGGITSDTALANPFHPKMSVNKGFFQIKWLKNLITDSHYNERERQGRHLVMLAQIQVQTNQRIKGLGIDEGTAVAIDLKGNMTVFGKGKAWFLQTQSLTPEKFQPSTPLTWNHNNRAVAAFTLQGSQSGHQFGNIKNLSKLFANNPGFLWVENGVLNRNLP